MMKGFEELLSTVYDIASPWEVVDCAMVSGTSEPTVEIVVQYADQHNLSCPDCGHLVGSAHDTRRRRWRAADWEWHRVFITCRIPRIRCPEHGFRQLSVPWAETGEQITRSQE